MARGPPPAGERRAVHGAVPPAAGTRPPRHRRPGDRLRDQGRRDRPRPPRHHAPGKGFIARRFPNIYARCPEFGFDMARAPLPGRPRRPLHLGGGVRAGVDGQVLDRGAPRHRRDRLHPAHGANRLASNSLPEGGDGGEGRRPHRNPLLRGAPGPAPAIPAWITGHARRDSDESVVVSHNWDELRCFMGLRRDRPHGQAAGARVYRREPPARDHAVLLGLHRHARPRGAQEPRDRRGAGSFARPSRARRAADSTTTSTTRGGTPALARFNRDTVLKQ